MHRVVLRGVRNIFCRTDMSIVECPTWRTYVSLTMMVVVGSASG